MTRTRTAARFRKKTSTHPFCARSTRGCAGRPNAVTSRDARIHGQVLLPASCRARWHGAEDGFKARLQKTQLRGRYRRAGAVGGEQRRRPQHSNALRASLDGPKALHRRRNEKTQRLAQREYMGAACVHDCGGKHDRAGSGLRHLVRRDATRSSRRPSALLEKALARGPQREGHLDTPGGPLLVQRCRRGAKGGHAQRLLTAWRRAWAEGLATAQAGRQPAEPLARALARGSSGPSGSITPFLLFRAQQEFRDPSTQPNRPTTGTAATGPRTLMGQDITILELRHGSPRTETLPATARAPDRAGPRGLCCQPACGADEDCNDAGRPRRRRHPSRRI